MRRLAPAALLLALAGCDGPPTPAEPLTVAAASDLQSALPDLIDAFSKEAGHAVQASYGSSGQFAQQFEQGARYDVFLSANRGYVTRLADAKVLRPDSVRDYARGSLVMAVFKDVEGVTSLDDLRKPEVEKIAIANPEFAPYGIAARQALRKAGLWDELQPKIVPAESVRQALQFVQSGNAEVGLVGKSIATVDEVRPHPIDDSLYDPIIQALGVRADTANREKADAFAAFVISDEGRAILAKHGFGPPAE
jgi:molybdate transport system substrate-binding protein